jgi:hypothetical protein
MRGYFIHPIFKKEYDMCIKKLKIAINIYVISGIVGTVLFMAFLVLLFLEVI